MSDETDVFEPLVRRSQSSDAEIRMAAYKQIKDLSDDDLLKLLANHTQPATPKARILTRRLRHGALYGAFAFAVAGAFSHAPLKGILIFVGLWLAAMALVVARFGWKTVLLMSQVPSRRQTGSSQLSRSIATLLIDRTDVRFLPYLLTGIGKEYWLFERKREGLDAIPPRLPLATAGIVPLRQAPVLTLFPREISQQRRRYRRLLKLMLVQTGPQETVELSPSQVYALLILLQMPEEDVEFTLVVLARLEHWGDAQAVGVLKRLIREKHWYVGSDRVEAAARQCLAQVEIRLQQQRQGATLLRPTQGIDAIPPQTLLRPAGEASENAPEQLLRPGRSSPPEERR